MLFEHDSVPDAMAAIYNMGKESGLWDTTMRTDTELLTKKRPAAAVPRKSTAGNFFSFFNATIPAALIFIVWAAQLRLKLSIIEKLKASDGLPCFHPSSKAPT